MKKNKIITGMIIVATAVIALSSCKRYVDPPPYFEEPGDTTKPAVRKVLLIGIDGAAAAEYKKMSLPILQSMLAKSKFTWDGISDEISTDATSWKTLMTGVSYSRHKIKDSTFIYSQSINDPQHASVPNFPSVFSYILSSPKNDMRTVVISPWRTMVEKLVPEVADPVVAANDLAVKDSALLRIKNGNPDYLVLNFNSVAIAGKAGAFLADNVGYKDAALKVDAYIGELLTALKARPGYNKNEEWLVIVTSTHGGNANNYGGSSDNETKSFSVYYHEKFKSLEFTKEGTFAGVELKNTGSSAVLASVNDAQSQGRYNFGTGEMTIQLKVKGNPGSSYPHFFHKKQSALGATPGFSCFSSGASWAMEIRSNSGSRVRLQTANTTFNNAWHTISIVVIDSAVGGVPKKWVKRYTDGTFIDQQDITSWGDISNSEPLTLGYQQGNFVSAQPYVPADLMVFNTGLTSAEINATLCLKKIADHPKYGNLIGYWPCTDGLGSLFKNLAPGFSEPMQISAGFQWLPQAIVPCNAPPLINESTRQSLLLSSSGVATTIFYWLKLNTQAVWGLEGSKWLETYEQEFVKL